jgi:signal transduction histidine kinase/CHASE3 domain sensor protein
MTRRLWRGLAVFVLLLAGAGFLVFNGIRHQDKTIDTVVRRLGPLSTTTQQIRSDFANSQAALRAYIITGDQRFRGFYRASRSDLAAALARAQTVARGGWQGELATQQRAAAAWFGYADRMENLPAGSPALARLTRQGSGSASTFYDANQRLSAQLTTRNRLAISHGQRTLELAVAWSAGLAFAAVLLGIVVAVGTIRGVTRPLASLTTTLRRLRAGDHAARAELTGAAETREVARSLNALADESDRLREQEAESSRLLAMARDAGFRIREHLRAEDVIREARLSLEQGIDADAVYLHVMRDGVMGPPEAHAEDWLLPKTFPPNLPPGAVASLQELLRNQSSMVIQDMAGPESDQIPPEIREPLRQAGVVSQLLTPFGVGSELLGLIAAAQLHRGHPWSEAQVGAVEWIAADLGRGLHHARLYEAENLLVKELKTVDQAKSDFLATVSHELRTPLTSIAGYLEILRDEDAGPLTPAQDRMLETIDRNTARLRHLIEDVLTLSRIESGAFKTAMMPVYLEDVITAVVAALQPAAARRGVSLSLSLAGAGAGAGAGASLVVAGDPGQLDRVLMNLLSNAVKFTSEGGDVRVTATVDDGMAAVKVSDTGLGIPERDQKGLFTRFFRASNAVERSIPGSGLGLAIVRTIVDNHGGDIAVESREGEGTTVTLRIPLLAATGAGYARREMPGRDAPPRGNHRSAPPRENPGDGPGAGEGGTAIGGHAHRSGGGPA